MCFKKFQVLYSEGKILKITTFNQRDLLYIYHLLDDSISNCAYDVSRSNIRGCK